MNPYPSTKGPRTDPTAVTNTDAPSRDHAITADQTRRYAAASTGLSRFSSATIRRWRDRRSSRHQGTSRDHASIANAAPISGSRSESSRKEARACNTVAASAITEEINVHAHMRQSVAATTDTGGPNG